MNRAEKIFCAIGTVGVYPLVQYERQQNAELRFVEEQQFLAQQQYLSQQSFGYPGQIPGQIPGQYYTGAPSANYRTEALYSGSPVPPNTYGQFNETGYTPAPLDYSANFNRNLPGRQQNQVGWSKYEVRQQPSPYLPGVTLSDTPQDLAQQATAGILSGWNRNHRFDLTMARDILAAAQDADEQNKRYHDYYHVGQKTDYYKEVKKQLSRDLKESTGGALNFKEVRQYGYPTVYAVEDAHRNFYT